MLISIAAALATVTVPQEEVSITARLDATELVVGGSYEVHVEVRFPEAIVASEAGAPAPFLQLDVPASVKLTGRALTTYKELAANEFIAEPYELLLEAETTAIPFELLAAPAPGESLGLNVLAYVSRDDGSEPTFLRRRLELAIAPGAAATEGDPTNSNWGRDEQLLQIGDKLEAFALPDADGIEVDVGEWIGAQKLVLSTYRAHW